MQLPDLTQYIARCYAILPSLKEYDSAWNALHDLPGIISALLPTCSPAEYHRSGNMAIHKGATVEDGVTLKEYTIIEEGAIVKAGAYLRDGVYLGRNVSVGANCEIKQSIIFDQSRIAHLNYVGNSLIGEDVNLEAGAILANHFNERTDKEIDVLIGSGRIRTGVTKFGALLGDGCRIGANAVLTPGTILNKQAIVGRLTLLDQLK
jgi:NDP-sugar pyrophosphorylase family protein